jgi:DNA-binding CsgD family transcriptional regulator
MLPIDDGDVAAIVRLMGEVAGMTEPLPERRRRLLEGLARLVGADVWLWTISRGIVEGTGPIVPLFYLDGGFADDAERGRVTRANAEASVLGEFRRIFDFSAHNTTHAGAVATPDFHRATLAPIGFAHSLFSMYPIGQGVVSGIGVHRREGRPPYSPRDAAIVHLVVGQVDWLHRAGTDVPANADRASQLSPRQIEVLIYLLAGDGRKQIAQRMGLSEHTVADHLKALHRHFGVASRGELLAKFVGGNGLSHVGG